MEGMLVYRLKDAVILEDGSVYRKGDIVSHETMDRIIGEYYEVDCIIIRIQ